jgi:crossover junction endodeoxyribonuclease RuvC
MNTCESRELSSDETSIKESNSIPKKERFGTPAGSHNKDAEFHDSDCATAAWPASNRDEFLLRYTWDAMRVFGIDCGTEVTGFGVVDSDEAAREAHLKHCAMGAIRLARARPLSARLDQVFDTLTAELERWQPDVVAVEEVFYSVNARSALKLGQVRGVALLAAARFGIPVAEYAPLKIKSSVVGYGLAKKDQVQFMVARLLHLAELPEPSDAADALAIAICHIHTAQTLAAQGIASGATR